MAEDVQMSAIRTFQHQHAQLPRACVLILSFPTHCGEDCSRGNHHTQDWNVEHMVGSLEKHFFQPQARYPVVIFHEDYTSDQERSVARRTHSPTIFSRVDLGPGALPEYLNLSAIAQVVGPAHRNGNLSLPARRGTYHGFGYRMMCRFFGMLVMRTPLMLEFDWYMRVDGGDSRITGDLKIDPISVLLAGRARYGYLSIEVAARNSRLDKVLRRFREEHPEVQPDQALVKPFVDAHGDYNGRYYYNNFEVLHLPTFRSTLAQSLFDAVDRSGAFMLGDTHRANLGDADFRSMTIPFLLNKSEVVRFRSKDIPYHHPMPWDAPYV